MNKPVPELYNTFLYDKAIVGVDGLMEMSEYPIECFLGYGWQYFVFHKRAAVAFCPRALDASLNLYWESVRGHLPRLHGTVVIFRHNAHVQASDVYPDFKARIPRFCCYLL